MIVNTPQMNKTALDHLHQCTSIQHKFKLLIQLYDVDIFNLLFRHIIKFSLIFGLLMKIIIL
jgi:hypothetical protein